MKLTAIIEADSDSYVSLCPELDVASQSDTITEARENLREALELFFEAASRDEIMQRLRNIPRGGILDDLQVQRFVDRLRNGERPPVTSSKEQVTQ